MLIDDMSKIYWFLCSTFRCFDINIGVMFNGGSREGKRLAEERETEKEKSTLDRMGNKHAGCQVRQWIVDVVDCEGEERDLRWFDH